MNRGLFMKAAAAEALEAGHRFHQKRDPVLGPTKWTGQPIVSLRRYGDIIALLPLLKYLSNRHPIKLVVHRAFANVLDGVSYVEPIIWDGDMDDPLKAARHFKAINAQVHGKLLHVAAGHNFVKKAWSNLGFQWSRHLPLVFDKVESHHGFPAGLILTKLKGFSSPFPDALKLSAWLENEFGTRNILNLDTVEVERIYHLLGYMDKAACMVSIDTAPLHLARASKCPVIALVNDKPHLASPPVGNVILRLPYHLALQEFQTISNAIKTCLMDEGNTYMTLVYQDFFPTKAKDKERYVNASSTWHKLGAYKILPFKGTRDARSVGGKRDTPFIRDMIEAGFAGQEDIVVITNNDIQFKDGLCDAIRNSCKQWGCYWAYRVDPETNQTDYGADLFALTRKWWMQHRHLWPDMLIGEPWWDNVMMRLMRWSGCLEQPREYAHEPHAGVMQSTPGVGWKYNEDVAMAWFKQHHENPGSRP